MSDYINIEWLAGRAYIVIRSEVAHKLTNDEIDRVCALEEKYNDDLNQLLKDILNEASKNATG